MDRGGGRRGEGGWFGKLGKVKIKKVERGKEKGKVSRMDTSEHRACIACMHRAAREAERRCVLANALPQKN